MSPARDLVDVCLTLLGVSVGKMPTATVSGSGAGDAARVQRLQPGHHGGSHVCVQPLSGYEFDLLCHVSTYGVITLDIVCLALHGNSVL